MLKTLNTWRDKYKWVSSGVWEFFVNVFFSGLPLLLGVIGLMLVNDGTRDFQESINYLTNKGELIIYSTTLMAPLIYAIQKDPPPKLKGFMSVFGITILTTGSFVYAFGLSLTFSDFIISLSAICFTCSLILFLTLNLVEHKTHYSKSAPQIFEDQKTNNLDEYQAHRRG